MTTDEKTEDLIKRADAYLARERRIESWLNWGIVACLVALLETLVIGCD